MSYSAKEVGPNRFRENIGRYFEDFVIGHIYEHRPGRTINEADNSWFTLLTMNTHPLHFDHEYAKHSEFGKPLVNSVGDTIYAESEVMDKRESKSRPTQGVVNIRTRAFKQDGVQFMSYDRAMLMPKRGHAVDDKANY